MSEWETDSAPRLRWRAEINAAVDGWCVLPVALLDPEDVLELRAVLRADYRAKGGTVGTYEYACWRAEVRLALGLPDPLGPLRQKAPAKRLKAHELAPDAREWARDHGARLCEVKQSKELGELFRG